MIDSLIIYFLVVASIIALVVFLSIILYNLVEQRCKHSYERIDTCNDKNMILVCRRCGKIKKLKK